MPALDVVPEFFAGIGYREPTDGAKAPVQMAFNTNLHMFEYVKRDPELARLFKVAVLSGDVPRRAHWDTPNFYPVQERLLSGLSREDGNVLMVDIAGGMGPDCEAIPLTPDPLPHRDTRVRSRLIWNHINQWLASTKHFPTHRMGVSSSKRLSKF